LGHNKRVIAPADNTPILPPAKATAPIVAMVGTLLAGGVLVACPQILAEFETPEERQAHVDVTRGQIERAQAECEVRGAAYFRRIGAPQRQSDGRDAADVIRERCERSPRSFR
jgi:hypothetical protein